jgi:transposase
LALDAVVTFYPCKVADTMCWGAMPPRRSPPRRLHRITALHRLREGYKEERTACINRIRGLLAEFGLVFAQRPEVLRAALPEVVEDANNELGAIARMALQRANLHWIELECHLAWCDERIAMHVRSDEQAKAASKLCGIGPVTASALVATVDDFKQFKNGRQFSAWMGLVPRQSSSGARACWARSPSAVTNTCGRS